MTNILNKINSLFPISDDTVQVLKENVTCCRFPKKYQLIKADTYCKSAFFIEKGITRSFWLVDGEEVTTSFAGEGSIVFSMDELYYGKISEEYVETLEEVEAYRISRATLTHLFETNIELCNWGRIIHLRRGSVVQGFGSVGDWEFEVSTLMGIKGLKISSAGDLDDIL